MREKSLDFLGYPNYSVTDDGKVFSLDYMHTMKKKDLKKHNINNGYFDVTLFNENGKETFKIHRLVALAFLPNPYNLPIINHKDENPSNNNVSNLEWCDVKYNCNYGTRNERMSKSKSIPIKQFSKDGRFIREWISATQVYKEKGYDFSLIAKCCKGRRKSAYNYIWRYA